MTHDPNSSGPAVAPKMTIAALRAELGLTQIEFAACIGLANKASVSLLERGEARCSLRVALAIEGLSGGRIDAAELSEDVKRARHGMLDTAAQHDASTGNQDDMSGQEAA